MVKFITVFTILTIVLIFAPGCPPEDYQPAQSLKPEPSLTGALLTEPAAAQSNPNALAATNHEIVVRGPNEPNTPAPGAYSPANRPIDPNIPDPNIPEPNLLDPEKIEHIVTIPDKNRSDPPDVKAPDPNVPDANTPKREVVVSFHDKCKEVLAEYVDKRGMVDYKKLKPRTWKLRKLLDEFARLERTEYQAWPKEDKIALWINAYNIRMLKVIVDNYPIQSTRWQRVRFWWPATSIRYIDQAIGGIRKQKLIVMNEEFALADIEQQILAKQFDEPRVLFGLCQASLDSPPIRNEPYCGRKLKEQLQEQLKKFLESTRAFEIDRKNKVVRLSYMFQPTVHGKKFVPKYGTDKKFKAQLPETRAVFSFLTNYLPQDSVSFLELENYSVEYIKYDWRLNDKNQ